MSDPAGTSTCGPKFALTFDTELIWGSFDHMRPDAFAQAYPDIRGTIRAILGVLERHQVAATWAVVGHLFLDACERDAAGHAHADLAGTRQSFWKDDWYAADPCTDLARDPLWYGNDIIDMIQGAGTVQEIASHSFGHPVYGDPAFTRQAAEADLRACIDVARKRGIQLRSFVFPRNVEAHHEALREHGFIAFRGSHPHQTSGRPRPLARARNLAEHALGVPPPVSPPTQKLPGLWDIKGSMLVMSRRGPRRLISRAARLRQAKAGLAAAVADDAVFHLWTHPFNLASDPSYLVGWLEEVILEAVRLQDAGSLRIETMANIAEQSARAVSAAVPSHHPYSGA